MKIIVQNLATEYKDVGSGKVLLFLHGWQGSLESFDSLVAFLLTNIESSDLICRVLVKVKCLKKFGI